MLDGRIIVDSDTGEVLKEMEYGDRIRTKTQDEHFQNKEHYSRNKKT